MLWGLTITVNRAQFHKEGVCNNAGLMLRERAHRIYSLYGNVACLNRGLLSQAPCGLHEDPLIFRDVTRVGNIPLIVVIIIHDHRALLHWAACNSATVTI